ncbi:MAG: hypothetical protein LBM04_07010, partial [Opitutaceae bacterium]|nr:hypothetical protein [Opitutaceae bacterium]
MQKPTDKPADKTATPVSKTATPAAASPKVKFFSGENIPLELHKVRVVQKLHLVPVERRLAAIQEASFNTYQLGTR